ncbi:MAG: DNA polymerase I, partial [Eubacterium sp.]|nr:DNA polymerase I [Eubacterium sp.]
MSERIVIIDGNSLINRAYYAMQKPMVTKEGIFTQGIFGFLNMLNKIMDEQKPDYMAVAWDRKAPTFRHKSYTDYKAGRKSMPPELAMELPLMKDILTAMHIPNFETDGFEADDIIGTIAREAEEAGLEPLIVTGDRDALQLVTDVTHVLITKKGVSEFELYDNDKMLERYGVTPKQFIDLKGLMGDSSDNIPGIPGVGEKTGIKLIQQFGSVADMLARTDEIANAKLRAKVEENATLAAMSRRLAEIVTNVPIEYDFDELKVREPDRDELIRIYKKLEFNKFLKALKASDSETTQKKEVTADIAPFVPVKIETGSDDAFRRIEEIPDGAEVGLKVFGNNDHVGKPRIDGIAIAYGGTVLFIPFPVEVEKERLLASLLDSKRFGYVGHDLVSDYYMLRSIGSVRTDTVFDTAVAQYVIDPSSSSYDIKVLAAEYLGEVLKTEKEVYEAGAQLD